MTRNSGTFVGTGDFNMLTHAFRRAAFFRILALCLVLAAGLGNIACESKVTKDNFEQIKIGMTLDEVERLLGGSGTEDSAPPGFGVSGGAVATTKDAPADRIYFWKDGGLKLIVTFQNGKVVQKSSVGE